MRFIQVAVQSHFADVSLQARGWRELRQRLSRQGQGQERRCPVTKFPVDCDNCDCTMHHHAWRWCRSWLSEFSIDSATTHAGRSIIYFWYIHTAIKSSIKKVNMFKKDRSDRFWFISDVLKSTQLKINASYILNYTITRSCGSAGLKMPIHAHFFGGRFWPVKSVRLT